MPPKPEPIAPVPIAPSAAAAEAVPGAGEIDPQKLTPEEQMALFEKDLKENDWGHQPC